MTQVNLGIVILQRQVPSESPAAIEIYRSQTSLKKLNL